MMFKIVAILLFVGAQAQVTTVTTTPATTVTTTPAPTGTTTPQYTGTTTPGTSNSVAFTMATGAARLLGEADDRRLSAFSQSQIAEAACRYFETQATAAGATISCSTTATWATNNWAVVSIVTSTVDQAATVTAALNTLVAAPATLTTGMITAFTAMGVPATGISCSGVTVASTAAQPYVAATYGSYASPPFVFSFHFANTAAMPSLTANTSTDLHNAVKNALLDAGLPAGSIGVDMRSDMGAGSDWGANCTAYVASTQANQVLAILQYLQANQAVWGGLVTVELKKIITTFANTIQTTNFVISQQPTGASATGVNVTVNGVLYVGTRLFDVEEDDAPASPSWNAAPTASWTLPVMGVFGLFVMVTFVGMSARRKQSRSTRQITLSQTGDVEEQPLVEGPQE